MLRFVLMSNQTKRADTWNSHLKITFQYLRWLVGDVEAHWQRTMQTSEAEISGSIPASPTMILMWCRINVNNVENLRIEKNYPSVKKKSKKNIFVPGHSCVKRWANRR